MNDIDMLNAQTLAFVGDSLFHLAVRSELAKTRSANVNTLHGMASRRVCAAQQAVYMRAIAPELTERETQVYRRGLAAKTGAMPKHATVADYREATAFEAILGFLYLSGEPERADELMRRARELCPVEDRPAPRPYKG